jgi:predicted MFS family arabinose efflux permease
MLITGLSAASLEVLPLAAAGLVVAAPALIKVLPAGTFGARPGLPAAVAVSFFANLGHMTVYAFFPLVITQVRGRSLAEGGIVVALLTISWTVGAWWQSRQVERISHRRLVVGGCLVLFGGLVVSSLALTPVPLPVAYAGWTVAGLGVGVFFQSLLMVAMEVAEPGSETVAVAATQLAVRLALAVGTGLGGAIVALGHSAGASLTTATMVIFALSIASALTAGALALRLPERT